MPIAFLLALQASGMVIDYFGTQRQNAMAQRGAALEQAGINANIALSRVSAEDQSLQAMKQLRQNLGTQAAMFAARGIRSGAGNAALITNESISNFNADERMRKINQLSNEAKLKAGIAMSKMDQASYENKNWNAFTDRLINKFPSNPSAYAEIGKNFGLTKV